MIYIHIPTPSTEYESKSLGTWSNTDDVNNFFSTHTPYNGWSGLKLGNYVKIQDGTYNVDWVIAGFNMEYNQLAADGTTYNNGYGICMIPKTSFSTTSRWGNSVTGGYKASTIHNTLNTTVANSLKTVLGNHLINRNVLLSSECNGTPPNYKASTAYEWTTAYCTLMSIGQMTGTFASHGNKYDDGEANYKLPLFNHEDYGIGSAFWSRGVFGNNYDFVWCIDSNGNASTFQANEYEPNERPLIYLR